MYSAEVLQQAAHQHGIVLLAVNPNRIDAATRTMFQGWRAQQFSDAILRSMVVFQQGHIFAVVWYSSGCLAVLDSLKDLPEIVNGLSVDHLLGTDIMFLVQKQVS